MIQHRKISPQIALAVARNSLVQSSGLMASLLCARHIVSRFRDAVVRAPQNQSAADLDSNTDYPFPDLWRGGYHGPFVPGAC